MDLDQIEAKLLIEKEIIVKRMTQAKPTSQRSAQYASALETFKDVLAIFQQHGSAEMSAMIERVRDARFA